MLTAPRQTDERPGKDLSYAVGQGAQIYQGGVVMLAAGLLAAGAAQVSQAAAAACVVVGVTEKTLLGDGSTRVPVRTGAFLLDNSAGPDAIALSDVGHPCFIVDDHTVAKTSGAGVRPFAGTILDVEADGVWVCIVPTDHAKRVIILPFSINQTDLLAGTAAELASPVSGTISRLTTVVQTAVTTGGDVTVDVAAVPVAALDCPIPNGAAKGSIVTSTPTLGDATAKVAAGQLIQVIPSAPFDVAGAVNGFVEISY